MYKVRKRVGKYVFISPAVMFCIFVFSLSILTHFLFPSSIRAAGELIPIKDPLLIATSIQPINLSGIRSIDISKIGLAATTLGTLQPLQPVPLILNEKVLPDQLKSIQSFGFQVISPPDSRDFRLESQLKVVNLA